MTDQPSTQEAYNTGWQDGYDCAVSDLKPADDQPTTQEGTLCDARMHDTGGEWCCIRVKHDDREHQWEPDTSGLALRRAAIREVNAATADGAVWSGSGTQERCPDCFSPFPSVRGLTLLIGTDCRNPFHDQEVER